MSDRTPIQAAHQRLQGQRLRLRALVPEDAAFVLALLTDAEFLRQIGDRGVHDLASAERYIREGPQASHTRHGFGLDAIELRDGRCIGICGLLRRDTHPDVELGFALLPQARGRGYAREAAALVLREATGRLGLRRLVALTAPDNAPSIRILRALGFRFERMAALTPHGPTRCFVYEVT